MSDLPIKHFTPKQFAQAVGISTSTLRRWEKEGAIHSTRTISGHRRFSAQDIPRMKKYQQQVAVRRSQTSKDYLDYYQENFHTPPRSSFILLPTILKLKPALIALVAIATTTLTISFLFPHNINPLVSKLKTIITPLSDNLHTFSNNIPTYLTNSQIFRTPIIPEPKPYPLSPVPSPILGQATKIGSFTINVPANLNDDTVTQAIRVEGPATINDQLLIQDSTNNPFYGAILVNPLTSDQTYTFPNASGEVSLLGQIIENNELANPGITITAGTGSFVTNLGETLIITGTNGITTSQSAGTITISSSIGTSIDSSEITDNTIKESDLNSTNDPSDNYLLSYDNSTGGFTWVVDTGTSSLWSDGGTFTYLTSVTDDLVVGSATIASAALYLDVSTGDLTLEGATINDYETTFDLTDPTADRTIIIPDAAGEISLLGQTISTGEITGLGVTRLIDTIKSISPEKILAKDDRDELYQLYDKLYKPQAKKSSIIDFYIWKSKGD